MIKFNLFETASHKRVRDVLRFFSNASAAILLGTTLLVAGCAHDNDLNSAEEKLEKPDVLYNQALANLNVGRLKEAIKKFDMVDRQNPYTEWARKAVIMGAFTNYRQDNYDEAVNLAKRYISSYSTSDEADYAYYIIGLSYYRQIPDITRDQQDAVKAVTAMQELIDRFPNSKYASDARNKLRFARTQLAGKEMQIGRYYQEREQYLPAINRYRTVVEQYSNTNQVEEALYRLVEANYALGLTSEAQVAASVLGTNYPRSHWYVSAYRLLKKVGYVPKDNEASWISKAFRDKNKRAF